MAESLSVRQRIPLGPLLLVAGAALLAGAVVTPAPDRSLWQAGVLHLAGTVDRVLPLVGLGAALARLRSWPLAAAVVLLFLGVAGGLVAEPHLVAAVSQDSRQWVWLTVLLGPLSCLLAGLVLVTPASVAAWLLPPVAVLVGGPLGVAARLDGPALGAADFTGAVVGEGLWLAVGVALTWRRFARPWFGTMGRILGSWLMAIGLLLGGALLAPAREAVSSSVPSVIVDDPGAQRPEGLRPAHPSAAPPLGFGLGGPSPP